MQFAYVRIGFCGMVKQECMAATEYKKIFKLVPLITKSLLSRPEVSNTDMYSFILAIIDFHNNLTSNSSF